MKTVKPQLHDKIVPVRELIHGIDDSRLVSIEGILQGEQRKYKLGERTNHGSADDLSTFENIYSNVKSNPQIKDQVVVDLGAGSSAAPYEAISLAGAKGYIGVEPHFAKQLLRGINCRIEELDRDGESVAKATVIDEDMLTFLQRLPDDSTSFLMSGIDATIVPDGNYMSHVVEEIGRALSPSGCYVVDKQSGEYPTSSEWKFKDVLKNPKDLFSGNLMVFVKEEKK